MDSLLSKSLLGRKLFSKGKFSSSYERPTPIPRLRALIIGIDKYASRDIKNLRGAVADAQAMCSYLRDELSVPANQIEVLYDKAARREEIIQRIRALGTLAMGQSRDDPLLIYFAGHGTTAKAPDEWPTGNKVISMLVPHDAKFAVKYSDSFRIDDIRNGDTRRVYPIPDLTVGALLHELADSCGDNITVILDCCHSGSGTRDGEDFLERGVTMDDEELIPANLDEHVWGSISSDRATDVADGFAKSGTRSHVLLAACREGERAREYGQSGVFTRELLNALRKLATSTVTYQELMGYLPKLTEQNPQCEGYYIDRILFRALAPTKGRPTHRVLYHEQENTFTMDAGLIHGVTDNAQFSVHSCANDTVPPLAIMYASRVEDFFSFLEIVSVPPGSSGVPSGSPAFAFLMLSSGPVLHLYLDTNTPCPVFDELRAAIGRNRKKIGYSAIITDQAPHLALTLYHGRVFYNIRYPPITKHHHHYLGQSTEPDSIRIHPVLQAASRFFWHLDRTPDSHQLREYVVVQMHETRLGRDGKLDKLLRPVYEPVGPANLLKSSTLGPVVDVVADDKTVFGIRLDNKSSRALHVWVFYFDCSDLSIQDYYMPPAAPIGLDVLAEPSLAGDGSLAIGYGPSGSLPFKYHLPDGQTNDVGIIKIFLSTEPVDLRELLQSSPFTLQPSHPKKPVKGSYRGSKKEIAPQTLQTWDTFSIVVRQHQTSSTIPAV